MNKTFATSLALLGALSAAGVVHAQGADGPSYPALAPIQAVSTRADVQAAARAAEAMPIQWQASPDGGTFPAFAPFHSLVSRAEVEAAARAAATGAQQSQYQASADGALYPALQSVLPGRSGRTELRMQARSRVGAPAAAISEAR